MKLIKSRKLSVREEIVHNFLFKSHNEIVEFDAEEFSDYDSSDFKRFEVKYDFNGNRIW